MKAAGEKSRLVIHVPHASTFIPNWCKDQFVISHEALALEALESADLWTYSLAAEVWPRATIMTAEVSRIVLDVERYAADSVEPMASVGRGLIYECGHDGTHLRRNLLPAERQHLLSTLYEPHWSRLRALASGGILIDLHSYPREPWTVELDKEADRAEIVLGTDAKLTPSAWRDSLVKHFRKFGYSVGLDRPYGGAIDAGAHAAIMLEIRRDMLGNGPGSSDWKRIVSALQAAPLPE